MSPVVNDDLVKQTVAFRIVGQFVDHIYGHDEKLEPDEFIHVFRIFMGSGGSWEAIIDGDMRSVALLEGALDRFIKWRNTFRTASRVASKFCRQYRSP